MAHTTAPQVDYVDNSECGDTFYIPHTYTSTQIISSLESKTLDGTTLSTKSRGEIPTFLPGNKAECASIKDVSSDFEVSRSQEQASQEEKSPDCISIFLDTECGEPLTSQHLRVDFTTIQGVDDTEFLLNKCAGFWNLVEGSKKLQELKVLPEKVVEVVPESEQSSEHTVVTEQGDRLLANHRAIDIIQRKGRVVDDCFMNKMKTRHCEAGSGDYFADSQQAKPGAIQNSRTPKRVSRHTRPREDVTKLCTELEQWGLNHPKSMEPPNHGPAHTYALLQRN